MAPETAQRARAFRHLDIRRLQSKLIVAAALGLLASLVGWAWPRDAKQASFHLVVVRRLKENGKPIVVFRVKVSDGRRIQITGAARIVNGETEPQNGLDPTWGGLWTLSHGSPLGNPTTGRNEFYVCEPTNSTVWQMRVYVSFEEPNFLKRVSYMPNMYRVMRKTLNEPVLRATKGAWTIFYSVGQRELDSDFITNTVTAR